MKPKEANKALPAKTSIAWTVSEPDGEGRQALQPGGAARGPGVDGRRRRARRTRCASAAPGRTRTGFPRLLLWAFLGGALMNLAPTVLALLLAGEILALRAPGVRERARGPRRR